MKKLSKLRDKIAVLQAQIQEAEQAEHTRKIQRLGRAAERAGLLDIDLESGDLEREFRAIAIRLGSVTESQSDTVVQENEGVQTPAALSGDLGVGDSSSSDPETATGEKKRWGWSGKP